jgi:small GTP-binding protein
MGSGGVGKSAVTIQFVNRQFEPKYDPTIEDRYQKVFEYKDVAVLLEILDTAGQETFSAMRELYMKNGEGFVLVYSITNPRSLEALDPIRNGILRHKQDEQFVPMILVGNKCDLETKREVETAVGKETAKNWGIPFLETSAKKDINIQEVFHTLIDMLWEHGKGVQKKETKSSRCTLL